MTSNDATAPRFDRDLAAYPTFKNDGDVVRLLGSRCPACGAVAFPRRAVCLRCGGEPVDQTLSGPGELHAWTQIENPPFGFDAGFPYGCVDLEEGPRVLCALIGVPRTGARVQAVAAPVRNREDGFRFRVLDA
jgi:uncharacterized OB-fold protein